MPNIDRPPEKRALNCPKCGTYAKKQWDSHLVDGAYRRYRKCEDCGFEFRTDERRVPEDMPDSEEDQTDEPESGSTDWLEEFDN